MIKYFKNFFYPPAVIYTYDLPKTEVIVKISEVLRRKVTFWGTNDMTGHFINEDTFVIDVVWPGSGGSKFEPMLKGQVIETQQGITRVSTTVKHGIVPYIFIFSGVIFGAGYLYTFFQTGSVAFLFWSLAVLVIGPFLGVGISKMRIAAVRERYSMYIHKKLISGN